MTDYIEEYILFVNNPEMSLVKAKSVRFSIINYMMHRVIENDLPSKQKECIRLYLDSYTQKEIASKLGIRQPTVCRHITNAKSKINIQLNRCFKAVEIALKEYGYANG